ncbi:MAG: Fatty acid oxidation complex subunit alpha [Hyphomicrobiaceae bacterium hypho_1]
MANIPLDLVDWHFKIDFEDIAWAVFDRVGESTNALGHRPLRELKQIIQWMETQADRYGVRGLGLLSGKKNCFIVGADIYEFDEFDTVDKVVDAINPVLETLDKIEALAVPVVCGIHGPCLGGGLELALACHYRIATHMDVTCVGFPEVKLGIIPGFNGTARAIRQVGPISAIQNMLTGSMLRASVGHKLGYIDQLIKDPKQLRWSVRKAILKKNKSRLASSSKLIMGKWPIRGFVADKILRETRSKIRPEHYPAPFELINLFRNYGGSYGSLKRAETAAFAPLMVSDTSRNLRRVFQLSEKLKAQALKNTNFKPLRVHVIGAGVMGADIAGFCVAAGMQVSLQDVCQDTITKGIKAQENLFLKRFKTLSELDAAKSRLIADPYGDYISRADVVIEAVVENLEIKQKLLSRIETSLKSDAIFCTNTSSIMIEDISQSLKDKGRIIGIHFFNPVAQMPLVEIIKGSDSRDQEIQRGCTFVRAINKLPLIVKSGPGFLVNRILTPYMFEAFRRLEAGEDVSKIDEAAKTFGMPIGPIELADTVGLDICASVCEMLNKDIRETRLANLAANGKLGRKSGEGFYVWRSGVPIRQDVSADHLDLKRLGRDLLKPLLDECVKCLDEELVESSDLIDAGVIFGTGFAPFRGGPLHYLKSSNNTNT